MSIRTTVVERIDRFEEIQSDWDDLCQRSIECHPMLGHSWLTSWWHAFGDGLDLYVILAYRGDRLVGAAPLAYQRTKTLLGQRHAVTGLSNSWVDRFQLLVTDPGDEVIDAFLDHLHGHAPRWDTVELGPLDDESPVTRLLHTALDRRRLRYGVTPALQSPTMHLPDDWDAVLSSLSSSFRSTVKRKSRKAEKSRSVEMAVVRDASCIDDIMTISRESWQHDNGTSMASRPEIRRFYTRIIEDAAKDGSLRVGLMRVDGEPAAFEFNLLGRSVLYNFKLGFRPRFASLSPGLVLRTFLIRSAVERKSDTSLMEFDFMGQAEPYKVSWGTTNRSHNFTTVFASRPALHFAHWIQFRAKPHIRESAPWLVLPLKTLTGWFRKRPD